MARVTAALVALLALVGGGATLAQQPPPEAAVRIESIVKGVAVGIPAGWSVQIAEGHIPGRPELSIMLNAQPPEGGASCAIMLDRTDRASLEDHADAFRPDGQGREALVLPAGEAIRWEEDQDGDGVAVHYLVDAPEGVLLFTCGGVTAPDDGWRSIADTIEFLVFSEE